MVSCAKNEISVCCKFVALFVLLHLCFHMQSMLQLILLQHLFYFETSPSPDASISDVIDS